jgi:hypothetical protein
LAIWRFGDLAIEIWGSGDLVIYLVMSDSLQQQRHSDDHSITK